MHRFLYFAGFTYIALCAAALYQGGGVDRRAPTHGSVAVPPSAGPTSSGAVWFAAAKPFCNPVEVDIRVRYFPPPATPEGAGYSAACFALAGKIDRARSIVDRMRPADRGAVAGVLFNVAHPVADAGDDRSAGPMMELVLEYWPNNYMALYHAGMSEFVLGQTALAEKHLHEFLGMYKAADGFTSAARDALGKVEAERGVRLRTQAERDNAARR